jgi:hypothetical protein
VASRAFRARPAKTKSKQNKRYIQIEITAGLVEN